MKVLLVNGSMHEHGTTFAALKEVSGALNECGVETDFFWIGTEPIAGCSGCAGCRGTHRCVIHDRVNEFCDVCEQYDGFVFGSPVHYAAMSGAMSAFMDRVFYCNGRSFRYKPGAAVAVARRGGTTATLDELNKYMTISGMPLVSSQYWNMVHGSNGTQAQEDAEGMQTMRVLGRNMAWLLKCIEAGKAAGVPMPETESRIYTNFIR